jgi:tetratricopeptide (TPR) repeat protein
VLDQFSVRFEGRVLDDPEVEATVRATMGNAYKTLGQLDASERELARALQLRRSALGESDPRTAESLADWGWQQHDRGAYAQAESTFRAALAVLEGHPNESPALRAELHHSIGDVLRHGGRLDEAEIHVRTALDMRDSLFGGVHERVAASMIELGTIERLRGAPVRAESLTRAAIEIERRVLDPGDPEIANALMNLAYALHDLDRPEEAEAAYREALEIRVAAFGSESAIVGSTSASLALLLYQRGRLEEALLLADTARRLERAKRGPQHPSLARTSSILARIHVGLGRLHEAEPLYRESLTIRNREMPNHWLRFDTMSRLGEVIARQRRFAEAEPLLLASFKGLEADSLRRERAALAAARLRDLYAAWGRPDDAGEWEGRVVALGGAGS